MRVALCPLGRFRLWGLVILVCSGMRSIPKRVLGVLIVSIHCAESLVFCGGFLNWSTVWGRVKACRPWGIASRCLGQEGSQNPQNFL